MADTITIIAPDGEAYKIPLDQVGEAILHGGKTAVRVAAPDGTQHWVPADQAAEALANGGTIVRMDGKPYPKGQAPVVVGKNSSEQPVWGNAPDDKSDEGFLSSFFGAIGGAIKGAATMFDPRANEFEKTHPAFNTPLAAAGGPITRMIEPQVAEGERAIEEGHHGNIPESIGHGLAAVTPLVGPMAANVGENVGTQVGEGDISGAAGTLAGNAAVAAAPEVMKNIPRASIDATRGRMQEILNPNKVLNTPVSPGDLTPVQRFEAAARMGVNLDRAQATNAPIPKMAKRVTEQSLGGSGIFERNNTGNVEALHQHAANVLDAAAPEMNREHFGSLVKTKLTAHRNQLADEPGQRRQASKILNDITPQDMTGEKFGSAAQQALHQHHDSIYERAQNFLTGALQRNGTLANLGDVEETANHIFEEENPYFDENQWALNAPGVKNAWNIVKSLKSRTPEPSTTVDTGLVDSGGKSITKEVPGKTFKTRELTPAFIAKMRSDLWNLYQSPEIVGTRAEGWLKQLTSSLDDALTSPENEKGLTPGEIQQFRDGTSLWKQMKSMYDDPQSPFFSILRSPEPKTVAGTLEKLKPTAARQFRDAMSDVKQSFLSQQQQRQAVSHLLNPTEKSGGVDLKGFADRWGKMPREQATKLLSPSIVKTLDNFAEVTQRQTPYDTPGSKLSQIIDAPDGSAATNAMFTDSGQLRLSPEEVRQMEKADPALIPQLRRQAIERQFDPAGNGFTDLRNFSSRWNRAQKEPLEGVLTPEQMQDLNDMASVAKTVNLPANPSGTAVVLQPAEEAGRLARSIPEGLAAGVGAGAGAAMGGPVGAAFGAVAAPVAETLARGAVAKRLVNPEATAAAMHHAEPVPIATAFKDALNKVNPVRGAVTAGAAGEGNQDQRQDVSTPPNGGEIGDVNNPEPNEVHNPVEEATQLAKLNARNPGSQNLAAEPQTGGVVKLSTPQGQTVYQAPEGATHEVIHPDGKTVLGHVVDGNYVPLNQ